MLKLVNNSVYFDIVITALSYCRNELDVCHEAVEIYPLHDNDNVYLICTTHELDKPLPKKIISYNFEQLTTSKIWEETFFIHLRCAEMVFDYSENNITLLRKKGISCHFLPLGYCTTMENTNSQCKDTEYDYIFTGCINQRRTNLLKSVNMLYYKYDGRLFNTNNIFGTQLNHLYRKTKAGLNIHHWHEGTILEVVRILPLIANNVIVVSERSNDKFYDTNLIRGVRFFNGENFTNQILSVRDMTTE